MRNRPVRNGSWRVGDEEVEEGEEEWEWELENKRVRL